MVQFVDSFKNDRVRVHFDTGNIMQYQFPEHWIPDPGQADPDIHFKEFSKRSERVQPGGIPHVARRHHQWPAVMAALDLIGTTAAI